MNDDMQQGDHVGAGDVEEAQAWGDANAGRIDRDGIARIEREFHALWLAGPAACVQANRLDPAVEARMRRLLKPVCGGYRYEEDDAVLAASSPTGQMFDHPAVKAYCALGNPPGVPPGYFA